MSAIEKINNEIDLWESRRNIEDSPLGGNAVKAALYGGTAAGLKIALQLLEEDPKEGSEKLQGKHAALTEIINEIVTEYENFAWCKNLTQRIDQLGMQLVTHINRIIKLAKHEERRNNGN